MRADMGKVLVERPRVGHSDRNRKKGYRKAAAKALAAGGGPTREGMKARTPRSKSFNEHLGPLRRFLNARVGRPWDAVYAEICAHVDHGNVVQKHVLTHLFDYVVTQVEEIDGAPFDARPRWRFFARAGRNLLADGDDHTWYVCPRTGYLRRSRHVPRPEPAKKPTPPVVRVGDDQRCEYRDGRWEMVTLEPVPVRPGGRPVVTKLPRRVIARRQLSRAKQRMLPIPIDWVT